MNKSDKIFVTGHGDMIGGALVRRLRADGYGNLLVRTGDELDLCRQEAVLSLFRAEKPDFVFLTSVRSGSIIANSRYPADFIYDNLMAECNVIRAAWESGVSKLLLLGSSCMYPRVCPQPMREEHLLSGPLEPSSEPYAIAKIAGASLCESYRRQYGANFISAIPGDNYGPEDDFNPETAHVVPALIRKCHEAKVGQLPHVTAYGSGTPKRELLYADDLADACLFLMRRYDEPGPINIGCGAALTIRDLCGLIRDVVGYEGDILFDTTMPDGAPAKYLDTSRINGLGWRAATSFEDGIRATYRWYVENLEAAL